MDGNVPIEQVFDLDDLPAHSLTSLEIHTCLTHSLPSLDAGFRHPCRNDGCPGLAGRYVTMDILQLGNPPNH